MYSLGAKGINWTHPAIAWGHTIDLDVLAHPAVIDAYWKNWLSHFPEVKYADISEYDDPSDESSGIRMVLNAKGRKKKLLEFSAFSTDTSFPSWNFNDTVTDLFATEMIGNVRVMLPDQVLLWKAEHGREKDRLVIESILKANERQNFLGKSVIERLVSVTEGHSAQDTLFE